MSVDGRKLLRPAALGLLAGFLSGLFGVGGGILIVPALVLVAGMDQRLAHGTSLAAVLPIAMAGVVGFTLEGSIDYPVAAALAAGAMAGAVIGTDALRVLPARALARAFSCLLLVTAIRLALDHSEASGRHDLTVAMVVGLFVVGLLSGTLAGLLGVGGGVVMVPAMIILFSIPGATAKGTSLLVIIPTAVVATRRNVRNGNADLTTAITVGVAGILSAFLASKVSVGLEETTSNALFAILLAIVALRMSMATFRRTTQDAGT